MRTLLLSFLFLSVCNINSQINLDSGLVACYALNGNAYEPINNLHGTLTGVLPAPNRFNVANTAVDINGGNIKLSSNSLLKPITLTFVSWIKKSFGGSIFYTEATGNDPAFSLDLDGSANSPLKFKAKSSQQTFTLNGTTSINTGSWRHICVTVDTNQVKIYVNGMLESTLNASVNLSYGQGKEVYLGNGFLGSIDDTRLYDRVLSAQEINQLYTGDPACVTATAAPVSSFSINFPLCEGQPVSFTNLSANNPDSWTWIVPGATTNNSVAVNPVYIFSSAGMYNVTLVCANAMGSDTSSLSFTVHPKPNLTTAVNPSVMCKTIGGNLYAFGAQTYTWSNALTGSMVPIHPTGITIYTVTGTGQLGCTNTSTVLVRYSIHCPTGILEFESVNISLYPNPGKDKFFIEFEDKIFNYYEVVDLLSRSVINGKLESGKEEIDLSEFPKGIYFVKLKSETGQRTIRWIKE